MTPTDRHARITTLFHDALEQPAAERLAWLERTCPDTDLRTAVTAMLAAHGGDDGFLDQPFLARTETGATTEAPPDVRIQGQPIGPWRIEERLGAGGMGVVYRASRADGLYERTVALKLLAPGTILASGEPLARRLAAERQILARLEHPGIARLYDGGVTEEGLPYLALELVDGEPITDYADRHDLDAAQRVDLFAQACDAVAYAHRNLVVHRDLKPAHILIAENAVGREATVKLLDFGVSALLGDPTGDGLTLPTVPRALTPSYAAPEQVRGEPVTTAADVYALGVVLYELLTGQRPYDLSGKTASEVERLVAEVEPPLPSTVASPERARTLRGDLDTIVMKALAKEPERRYASAEALALDLRRHLRGLPVEARPATARYRLSRFVRRHRVGVAATAAVVLVTATLIGFYTARLAAERDRTAEALLRAEGTLAFLEETILSGDPQQGDFDAPLSAVLDSAAARVEAIEDPAVAAAVGLALATVYIGRGLPEPAEQHAREAFAFYDAEEEETGIPTTERGQALNQIATAIRDQRRLEDALPYHAQAIAHLRRVEDGAFGLSLALNNYGATLFKLDQPDEAVAAYREAIALRRDLTDPKETDISTPLLNIAVIMTNQRRDAEAAEAAEELIAELRPSPDPKDRHTLAFVLYSYATALRNLGRTDEAIEARREGIAIGSEVMGADHPNMMPDHIALVTDLHLAGRTDEAIQKGEEVLAWIDELLGPDHSFMSLARTDVGRIYCENGDPARGAQLVRLGLENRRQRLSEDHMRIREGESLLGDCLRHLGRHDEAEPLLTRSYRRYLETDGPDNPDTQSARERLRAFYEATGQRDQAATLSTSL